MNKYDLIVIGAGASGLMAAGRAAELGGKILVLEKMKYPARKLRITGKGRCNLTNIAEIDDFLKHIGRNGRFLRHAFSVFFSSELVSLFNRLGVKTVIERGGRVFPESGQAKEIAEALVAYCKSNGVQIFTKYRVEQLLLNDKKVIGVSVNNKKYFAKNILIATGGASYPATGSSGDGYQLAKTVGHSIIPVHPVLVPMETMGNIAAKLQNINLRNINATIWIEEKKVAEKFGEMSFTDFGVTGPVILTLSRQIAHLIAKNKKITLSIDLKPALDDKKLDLRLQRDIDQQGKKSFYNLVKNWLPMKMIPAFIELTLIPADKPGHQITTKERKKIRLLLKKFELEVVGFRPFSEAIVTAGGVSLKEVNPKTMASRLIENLYFAGEVLDLDADTGGYNLQIAFSTAWLVGQSLKFI
jgi:hypothetical protein